MNEVSVVRLNLMRVGYLLIIVGLAFVIWPHLIHHSSSWALKYGDTSSLPGGLSLLALLGLRYPLQMLPLLLFELTWKIVWLTAIALPLWSEGQLNEETKESIFACGMGVVIMPFIIPWKYVFQNYVKKQSDRFK